MKKYFEIQKMGEELDINDFAILCEALERLSRSKMNKENKKIVNKLHYKFSILRNRYCDGIIIIDVTKRGE